MWNIVLLKNEGIRHVEHHISPETTVSDIIQWLTDKTDNNFFISSAVVTVSSSGNNYEIPSAKFTTTMLSTFGDITQPISLSVTLVRKYNLKTLPSVAFHNIYSFMQPQDRLALESVDSRAFRSVVQHHDYDKFDTFADLQTFLRQFPMANKRLGYYTVVEQIDAPENLMPLMRPKIIIATKEELQSTFPRFATREEALDYYNSHPKKIIFFEGDNGSRLELSDYFPFAIELVRATDPGPYDDVMISLAAHFVGGLTLVENFGISYNEDDSPAIGASVLCDPQISINVKSIVIMDSDFLRLNDVNRTLARLYCETMTVWGHFIPRGTVQRECNTVVIMDHIFQNDDRTYFIDDSVRVLRIRNHDLFSFDDDNDVTVFVWGVERLIVDVKYRIHILLPHGVTMPEMELSPEMENSSGDISVEYISVSEIDELRIQVNSHPNPFDDF
jgi:hypothetical protein